VFQSLQARSLTAINNQAYFLEQESARSLVFRYCVQQNCRRYALNFLLKLGYILIVVYLFAGVFNHTIAELSAKYSTEVTPAAFAFGVAWGIIYIWNVLINGFLLVSLVLPAEASPVKFNPTLAPKVLFCSIKSCYLRQCCCCNNIRCCFSRCEGDNDVCLQNS